MAGSNKQIPRKVGGSRAVGDFRYKLYRAAILQLNKALEQEFYIEATMICDSIINDRLEARIQYLYKDEPHQRVSSISTHNALEQLEDLRDIEPLIKIYEEVKNWVKKRNIVAHSFVKYQDVGTPLTSIQRFSQGKITAVEGKKLMRKLSNAVKRYNSY